MTNDRFTVLVTDRAWPDLAVERDVLEPLGVELIDFAGDDAAMIALGPRLDAILTCWRQMPPELLDNAPACRMVSRYGIGLDNIPVARATELGMVVTNVPDFCLDEVSDHAMALLLAAARRIVAFAGETAQGTWRPAVGGELGRLRGRTLGIVGYGNIGRALAPKARAFGLNVLVYTPRLTPGPLAAGVTAAGSLDELLGAADFVSLHLPANEQTRHLIDEPALRAMKPTAWLINTSRGAIVDEAALVRALDEGWIAGAALDVLASEPPPADHPLLGRPDTIVTPHVAFASAEAMVELRRRAAEHVAHVLRGERPPHIVNPAVLAQSNLRAAV
ncbi:MAG: C-terminal binding protein [Thermomicrobiales bacterium]|nr:C-terminal binding protein [Thermomicrobiales bacterium]